MYVHLTHMVLGNDVLIYICTTSNIIINVAVRQTCMFICVKQPWTLAYTHPSLISISSFMLEFKINCYSQAHRRLLPFLVKYKLPHVSSYPEFIYLCQLENPN